MNIKTHNLSRLKELVSALGNKIKDTSAIEAKKDVGENTSDKNDRMSLSLIRLTAFLAGIAYIAHDILKSVNKIDEAVNEDLDDKKYLESLSYLEKVIPLCKKSQKYNQLAIAYARKGIILTKTGRTEEGSEYIKKACAILHAIEDTKLLSELEKELSHYLNMESENPLQLDMLLQE